MDHERPEYSVLNRLYCYSDFEKRRAAPYTEDFYHLNNIKKILSLLDNPQNSFQSIHIAGTKGKGSCVFFVAYFLEELGYRTGHTVSPHLIDERDRFFYRGNKAKWEEIIPIFDRVLTVVENEQLVPTVFDIITAVAFLWFKECQVEIAIIETGLGGRWDSTNILRSNNLLSCLITTIGYDHMDKLGNTLVEIAQEKAGIIKSSVPVFTFNTDSKVIRVLREKATSVNTTLNQITTVHPFVEQVLTEIEMNSSNSPNKFFVPQAMKDNLNFVVQTLVSLGYPVNQKLIKTVLEKLPIAGRYQKRDNILIDGAHNLESIAHLVNAIQQDPNLKKFKHIKLYFYSLFDKDIAGMVNLIPQEWELSFFDCELPFVQLERVNGVKNKIDHARGKKVDTIKSFEEISSLQQFEILHVFCGSFKLVGKVLQYWERVLV